MPRAKTRKTKRAKPTEPQPCHVAGCPNVAREDDDMCVFHATLTGLAGDAAAAAKRAFRDGDLLKGMLSSLGGLVLKNAEPFIQQTAARYAQPAATPQAPPPASDPWKTLGLDPKSATEADVQAIRKAFARLYHPDRAQHGVNQDKMAEVNAAAEACLKQIKMR
jgi:hypothetical protein